MSEVKVTTPQEEIQAGLEAVLEDARVGDCNCDECRKDMATALIKYLDSKGGVLKIECPLCCWGYFSKGEVVIMSPCYSCNSTGYLLEPLVKVDNDGKD